MRQIGELYSRLPAHYATANVLAHSERVPDTHILVRGDWQVKGDKVEPGFPPVLNAGPSIDEPRGVLFVPQRRKALALWMTSPDNPLVARVMVNRIWQNHFGAGIVATPNDFGRQGDAPTHPELLDWLATEFVARGWSVKQMHRLIMLSNTYRASSVADPGSLEKDPENHLLSRMNRRRLDGDSLRDTILAVSGNIESQDGWSRHHSAADQRRTAGGADAESLAAPSGPGGIQPAQYLSADETVAHAAHAANLRRAGPCHQLSKTRRINGGAAGSGPDEQHLFHEPVRTVCGTHPESGGGEIPRRRSIRGGR